MDYEEMRQQLSDRVKENYADYCAGLLLKDRQELIDGAGRIARTAEVFQYFTDGPLSETEVEYHGVVADFQSNHKFVPFTN